MKDPVWKYKWVENNEPEVFEWAMEHLALDEVGVYLQTAKVAD